MKNYIAMNQMTSFGDEKITYDVDGNRTSDGKFDYNWNSLGQLIKLTNKSNNDTWYYQYDEQGRRITKTHNDSTVHYHYYKDTNHLIAESKDGKVIREYIRDQDGNLLGLKIGDQFYNYHKNYRGDIIGITDMSGNQLVTYTYDSWGNIVKEEIKDDKLKEEPFRYASYFFDNESEQYYLMARYYNPKQGVFISIDPELSGDESVTMNNGYAYANNNPVKNIDADGKWFWAAAGGAWGAYDGHRWAKKRGYTGWKYYGSVAGGAALGASGAKFIGKAYKTFKNYRTIKRNYNSMSMTHKYYYKKYTYNNWKNVGLGRSKIFHNKEGLLPKRPKGNYREWNAEGWLKDETRGPHRFVVEKRRFGRTRVYYTPTHYRSFYRIR